MSSTNLCLHSWQRYICFPPFVLPDFVIFGCIFPHLGHAVKPSVVDSSFSVVNLSTRETTCLFWNLVRFLMSMVSNSFCPVLSIPLTQDRKIGSNQKLNELRLQPKIKLPYESTPKCRLQHLGVDSRMGCFCLQDYGRIKKNCGKRVADEQQSCKTKQPCFT